ncbi:MAG: protein jag [Clostridia bacterium]|nr:protein jag [Clostridia bacterium]
MTEQLNEFTAKTVDEAIAEGLSTLGITLDEAEITVLEEGRKKLFGSVKAKVIVRKRRSDANRAAEFIDGLMEVLGITAATETTEEEDFIKIDIKTTQSSRVIGKRGDVLDAVQCMAGAVANIGRDDYKKVVVDCESYRSQREDTLKALAEKLAVKAVEKGRKMILEPMNPYERRIIHSALADNTEVKTISEGKEPYRYIAVIPNNAKPYDKGLRYDRKKPDGEKQFERRDRRDGDRPRGERKFDKRDGGRRSSGSGSGAKRGKKEIHFGTFLGNSNSQKADESAIETTDSIEE